MKISVDAMGGDNAPKAVIEGCIAAIKSTDIDIILTGPESLLQEQLSKYDYDKSRIEILDAPEVIGTNEHPVMAIRKKKNSSLNIALDCVKNGKSDAVISAGSTGAILAGGLFKIGRIEGVERPAIAPMLPGKNKSFIIIDVGANVDCKPSNLLQFGIMGNIYMQDVMGIEKPSIGLINIGAEEEKGNELTKSAYKLLKESKLNFIGNVEPRYIPNGDVDVLVSDGFVGNTFLKTYEGVASTIFSILKTEIKSSLRGTIGGLILKPVFSRFKKRFDYKEIGGAPFLGIDGICIKAHGSSDAKAIYNAIRQAKILFDKKIIDKIKESITESLSTES
ncbi:phosphate acyltransferase PlsX [Clostridium oryzae]|uniref:Phosphate acyltransferase n=1 Tax=Clostridium oryzae TaxID=1450648 RepID=A0A1V4IPD1_9CLOT|nr:phosphate acyltransferase PlsX [Clostridium oryzae]OPJ61776.1 phosphate acyltransferase [Clostridium oryzae]